MLILTQNAIEAVKRLAPGDEGGLRLSISAESAEGAERSVQLAIVEAPADDDRIVSAEGANLFLEPEAAEALDDMVLDAAPSDGRVRFGVKRKT